MIITLQSYVSSFPPLVTVQLHPVLERNKLLVLTLTYQPLHCRQTGTQWLSRNKRNPVKDIWYFKVAVFFMFNNRGWTQGTAHDIKWTFHRNEIPGYPSTRSSAGNSQHWPSASYLHLFQVQLPCKERILRQSAFLPTNQVTLSAKNILTFSHGYRGGNSKDHPFHAI